jgi:16S rRNA (adenine1518-N6/adenine1519-N6)-dimethyltransferase
MSPSPSFSGPLRPRRRFGQSFLVDRGIARRIVETVDAEGDEVVVEIGPGRGALTGGLLDRFERIAAVEVDRDLAARLRERYDPNRLVIVEKDVLRTRLVEVAARLSGSTESRVVVVSNLPYNISKPFADKLTIERDTIARAVLMFQREVAERITASPGTRAYGPLSVMSGRSYRVETLFDVPPAAFRPRPKVVSTVTRWISRTDARLDTRMERSLRAVLGASFARRRQTLLRNLRAALPGGDTQARDLLQRCAIDPGVRAETLTAEEFVKLAGHWPTPRSDSGPLL